ncbi:hypothetical protein ZIOFF_011563 [Zingiber officinale]|uniref:BRX domain-containing protein n=2 Tax=Zingiber officinale TaxID=94328 RepID=A0A8J5HQU1_ZINOF|nr:hypothetical protein ZIOFF_011563 [Zingiber officinale]
MSESRSEDICQGKKGQESSMLACIACTKHEPEDVADGSAARPSPAKDTVKSLTSQLKDMVLKFSGTHRHCKGRSTDFAKHTRRFHHSPDHGERDGLSCIDGGSRGYDYLRAEASSSSVSVCGLSSSYNVLAEEGEFAVEEEEGEVREWTAQVDPGVQITFVSLPGGAGNDLKRIRFNREMFDKWQAQRWWGENYDRVVQLYNVRRFSRQAFPTPPCRSDEAELVVQHDHQWLGSQDGLIRNTYGLPPPVAGSVHGGISMGLKGGGPYHSPPVPDPSQHLLLSHYFNPAYGAAPATGVVTGVKGESSSIDASRTTTSSRDEVASVSISNASDLDVTEWVEQVEPGVCITLRELSDGTRELRRVRFSREKFGEMRAKIWWEENIERIQAQFL